MGDQNQYAFALEHLGEFRGPVLEIGSKDYGSTPNLRPLFPDTDYVGIDLQDGDGVDFVLDMTQDFGTVDAALGGRRFGTIFCLSVLEHVRNPFVMCQNIMDLLAPEGRLYVSAPFTWEFHGFPADYWRFTPDGIKALLPGLDFPGELSCLHTPRKGDTRPIDEELGGIFFSTKKAMREKRYGHAAAIGVYRLLKGLGLGRWLFEYTRVFPPVMIDMVGINRADAARATPR